VLQFTKEINKIQIYSPGVATDRLFLTVGYVQYSNADAGASHGRAA